MCFLKNSNLFNFKIADPDVGRISRQMYLEFLDGGVLRKFKLALVSVHSLGLNGSFAGFSIFLQAIQPPNLSEYRLKFRINNLRFLTFGVWAIFINVSLDML